MRPSVKTAALIKHAERGHAAELAAKSMSNALSKMMMTKMKMMMTKKMKKKMMMKMMMMMTTMTMKSQLVQTRFGMAPNLARTSSTKLDRT
jgi:hypothetical protein